MRTLALRKAVLALPIHSISGYEWDCDLCQYDSALGQYVDSDRQPCDHGELLDRGRVLALLSDPEGIEVRP